MKPYYEDSAVQIFHGDCREILPSLPQVDLVLTDPPYGIGLANHSAGKERRLEGYKIEGDEDQSLGNEVLTILMEYPQVVFASPMKPWAGSWRQYLVWDKGPAVGGGGDPKTCWKQTWELIQVRGNKKFIGPRDSAVINHWITPQNSVSHPAAKPLAVLSYLLVKLTLADELILDPFLGSGTTLRAAKDLGRAAIGIEIEERYCEIAAKRMSQSVMTL